MAIDRDEVRRIAELARLEIPEGEIADVARQLSGVLDFAARLGELDLEGCEPASLAPADGAPRADVTGVRMLPEGAATAQAPEAEDGFFLVPPVVENLEP